jgi:hypothetical protein
MKIKLTEAVTLGGQDFIADQMLIIDPVAGQALVDASSAIELPESEPGVFIGV